MKSKKKKIQEVLDTLDDKKVPTDAENKAMRIAYAYSQNPQSAAELVQSMIDGAVQEGRAELITALETIANRLKLEEWHL